MIPRCCYPDLVPARALISTIDRSSGVNGNVSGFELDVINRLVRHLDPKVIFEIGTFDGRTTLNMASHCASTAKVFTLDLPPSSVNATALPIEDGDRLFIEKLSSGARYVGTDVAHKIVQLYGDSASFDFSPYWGTVDFVFVDGSHSYDYVVRDSLTALRLVKPNGMILWHDYVPAGPTSWPGLRLGLHDLLEQDHRFRRMKHIAGTDIVILPMSAEKTESRNRQPTVYGDSTQSECLLASLLVEVAHWRVQHGTPLRIHAQAVNTGKAVWLPSHAPVGPVRLGSRLIGADGTWIDDSYSRSFFPQDWPVAPGETATLDGEIPCPPPGRYIFEFDLVAEGVTWFSRNGVTAMKLPIDVL